MATEISNSNDIIGSRDLIEMIEDMESERGDLEEAVEDAEDAIPVMDVVPQELLAPLVKAKQELADWDENNGEELKNLKAFAAEFENYCDDWNHGVTMIRESYFTEYAEELVKDIGDLPKDIPSYLVIDWDATAENLKVDYAEGEFDGVTYYAR